MNLNEPKDKYIGKVRYTEIQQILKILPKTAKLSIKVVNLLKPLQQFI